MNKSNIFIGTELKLNINIEPIGGVTMSDYDFTFELYCSPKKNIIITKEQSKKIDDNNYIVLIDTNEIGVGSLKCKVIAYIPDEDFPDSLRTEISLVDTGITIVKS